MFKLPWKSALGFSALVLFVLLGIPFITYTQIGHRPSTEYFNVLVKDCNPLYIGIAFIVIFFLFLFSNTERFKIWFSKIMIWVLLGIGYIFILSSMDSNVRDTIKEYFDANYFGSGITVIAFALFVAALLGFLNKERMQSNTIQGTQAQNALTPNIYKPFDSYIKNPVFWAILIVLIIFTAFLGWKVNLEVAFAFLAIAVSIFFAVLSIRFASQALELTQNTQRPFVNTISVSPEPNEPAMRFDDNNFRITLHIKNTGNLPADNVSITSTIFTINTGPNGDVLEHAERYAPKIYFPGDIVAHTFKIRDSLLSECRTNISSLLISIAYINKTTGRECLTKRYFEYPVLSDTPTFPLNSTHENDCWK